jgi:lipopolysaccharide exporter
VKDAIGAGAVWLLLLRIFDRVCGFGSTLVLARLLAPADFGIVAMAMSVIALFELVTAFGFDVVLIQKAHPERKHFDTAWTLSILLYIACALGIGLLSIPVAAYYSEPRLIYALIVIAAGWVLRGFENPGMVEFRRSMAFSQECIYYGSIRIISGVITVAAALTMRSYWALIVGTVAGRVAGLCLSFQMVSYRPRFDLSAARDLFSFSGWLLVNNATLVGVVRFPHFFIGRLLGPHSLGLFTLSYELATMPATEVSSPVNRAALPGYSRLRDDRIGFRDVFMDVGALVLALAMPLSAGLVVIADPAVRLLLGDKWMAAVPLVRILAISALFVAATGNNGVGQLALGYANMVTLQSWLRLIVLIILCIVLGRSFGIPGIAVAELCGAVVCFLASFPVICRKLNLSFRDYAARIWRCVIATLAMAAVVSAIQQAIGATWDAASALRMILLTVPAGAATYVSVLIALWWLCGKPNGTERIMIDYVGRVMRLRFV